MKKAKKTLVLAAIAVIAFIAMLITACSDSPGGTKDPNEEPLHPPIEMPLKVKRWGSEGSYMAHQWESEYLKLSDFTNISPKSGDVLQFKISGKADKELKYIVIQLFQGNDIQDDNSRKYLGGSSGRRNIGTTFTNSSFDILITADINSLDGDVYVQVVNLMWELDPSGSSMYGDVDKIPDSIPDGTLMATISKFTMTVDKKTVEDLTDEERWSYYSNDDSTAKLTHFSIASDNTVTATVAGTPEPQGAGGVYRAWKVTLQYFYTAKTNTSYIYKFSARTETGTRSMPVQYYEDNDNEVYLGKTIEVTSSWQEFTIKGERIPKAGAEALRFQLANCIGTVHIKVISITENTDVIKTITVTGIPSGTGNASLTVYNEEGGVAYGWGNVNGSTAIFNLHDDEDEPWGGSGSYYLSIYLENSSGRWIEYRYTNGQPYSSGRQEYNITSANSTIAFNRFAALPNVGEISGTITLTGVPAGPPRVYIIVNGGNNGQEWSGESQLTLGSGSGTFSNISWSIPLYGDAFVSSDASFRLNVEPANGGNGFSINIPYSSVINSANQTGIALGSVNLDVFTPVSPSSLTANTWHNGNITASGHVDWYSISVISGTRYYLWWNDSWEGDESKTLDIDVYALYNSTNLISLGSIDSAWNSPVSFTASSTGTVYIRVRAYDGWPDTGTYAIVYNTTGVKP